MTVSSSFITLAFSKSMFRANSFSSYFEVFEFQKGCRRQE